MLQGTAVEHAEVTQRYAKGQAVQPQVSVAHMGVIPFRPYPDRDAPRQENRRQGEEGCSQDPAELAIPSSQPDDQPHQQKVEVLLHRQ